MSNGEVLPAALDELPEIPGGWAVKDVPVAGRTFRLELPADPDLFLEDPEVHKAHVRDDYMPYWPYLWPASVAMSRAFLRESWPVELPALEIGAGIGLVGLAALACGLRVTFSDYDPNAVAVALHNARLNGFDRADGQVVDWRDPPELFSPFIFGCDVVYERQNHGPILNLLDAALTPDGFCWIGDQGRQHAAAFIELARQRGFTVELRDEAGTPLDRPAVATFQLLVLRRRSS